MAKCEYRDRNPFLVSQKNQYIFFWEQFLLINF
jgi:hypothetical protein